ncbi:MAG: hypothetical protein KDB05_14340 [Planctomycetales bacterium]|nr:hypothetical protein [Planctomycetales bacterium]
MEGTFKTTTIYRLPKSRLKRQPSCLDWLDDYELLIVDVEFCDWLAELYDSPSTTTNAIVARDNDAHIELYRWNIAFAHPMTTGETDAVDGMFGGDSATSPVTCFPTWMTQRQAWHMWGFFRSSIRDDNIVVELRFQRESGSRRIST